MNLVLESKVTKGIVLALGVVVLSFFLTLFATPAQANPWNGQQEPSVPFQHGDSERSSGGRFNTPPAPTPTYNPPPRTGNTSTNESPPCGWTRHWSEPTWFVQNCTRTASVVSYYDVSSPSIPSWVRENLPLGRIRVACHDSSGVEMLGQRNYFSQSIYRIFDEASGSILWQHTSIGTMTNRVECIERRYTDTVRAEYCYVGGEMTLSMNTPTTRNYGTSSGTTSWGRGNHTLEACAQSKSVEILMDTILSDMGRYSAYPVIHRDRITVREYSQETGTPPAPEIIDIQRVAPRNGPTMYAQVTCDPDYSGAGTNRSSIYRGSWSWTWSDCLTEGGSMDPTEYRCVGNGAPSINGGSPRSSATLFRDAEPNTIEWNNPRIQSDALVRVNSTQTRMTRSGTPWNTPRNLPVGNNNVTLHTDSGRNVLAGGNSWMNGKQDSYVFRANWASDSGAPTVLNPRWRFDATWRVQGVRIISMDAGNGTVYTVPWWTTTDATADCTGRVSLNVVRAVNDSEGY